MLAFYYAWYDESTWTSGTTVDIPSQPYRSSDVATIERHVSQAQTAGIDALVQSWYGPQETNNQTETNFRTLLDVAAGKGFHAAIAFETNGPFFPDQASVVEALRHLLTVHAQHPAYLRYQGRPVIFFWRQQRFSVDTWEVIRAELDPERSSIWIAEGTDLRYQRVFDGHYLYSIAWSSNVARTLQDWGQRVRGYARDHGTRRLWVATVMPGYDDTRSGRANTFAVSRNDGNYYRTTWSAAIASRPDWVVITSFNEWVEGTMIEPSVRYGDLYLHLTRELSAQFKGALASETSPPVFERASPITPELTTTPIAVTITESGPRVRAKEAVRIRSGPDVAYPRIGRLAKGEQARVLARTSESTWWQIEIPTSNARGWVSAAFVELLGDADTVPVVEQSTATPPMTSEAGTATPMGARYATARPATLSPERSETVRIETPVTPRPAVTSTRTGYGLSPTRAAPSVQPQVGDRAPTATIPPFITPRGVVTGTLPSNAMSVPAALASSRASRSFAETKIPSVVETSSIVTVSAHAEAISPLPSAFTYPGKSDSTEDWAIRQPRGMVVHDVPPLLWAGSAALLAALVLLVVLLVCVHGHEDKNLRRQ